MTSNERIAALYGPALVLYRVGDFWQAYSDDANKLAQTCGVARTVQAGEAIAALPYHSLDVYAPKLRALAPSVEIVFVSKWT